MLRDNNYYGSLKFGLPSNRLHANTHTHRHTLERGGRSVNGSDYKWSQRPQEGQRSHHLMGGVTPKLGKPVGSLLSIWTNKKQVAADSCHQEFAGRSYGSSKAELYKSLRTNKYVSPRGGMTRLTFTQGSH